jgi:hypothetical protein
MALSTRLQEAEIRQQLLTIWKKLVRISDTMVVVPIPEFLVKKLHIDEECNWFKVIPTETGILLENRVKKANMSALVMQ